MKPRNILVTLECFVKKDGKYLMLHRSPHKRIMPNVWMAPGGKREFNEGLFAAARREVLEETGLTIKNLRIKAHGNAYMKDIDQEFYFHFVFADYAGGEVLENPADGTLEWLTPEEILRKENMLPEIHEVAPYIFNDDDKVISFVAEYGRGTQMTRFEIELS